MKDHLGNEGGEILRTAKRLKKKIEMSEDSQAEEIKIVHI